MDTTHPAWTPPPGFVNTTNMAWLMRRAGVGSYEALHAWSVENLEAFWSLVIERLGIRFQRPFSRVADLLPGVETPRWLPGARLNIVEELFHRAARFPAIIHQAEGAGLQVMSVSELEALTNRVAVNLKRHGTRSVRRWR